MKNQKFAFSKINFILVGVGMLIIIGGLLLMAGPSSTDTLFEQDIFSPMRIKVAPVICFFGFIFMIFAIMYTPHNRQKTNNTEN